MKLYCSLKYKECFEGGCDGYWCNTGEDNKYEDSTTECGYSLKCRLPRDKYGKEVKKIKLISEFKYLINKAVYKGEKCNN